jgi:3-keto-5-aminohexanoate cleavage enzyme
VLLERARRIRVKNTPLDSGTPRPRTPQEVAREVTAAAGAGAAAVHLHVRDEESRPTSDLEAFRETVRRIRNECDIIVQGSTGGLGEMSAEERCVVLDAEGVETASLNMGSTNFFDTVYVNSPQDIRFWAGRMRDRGIVPELEIFSLDMIHAGVLLQEEGILEPPLRCCACLGVPGAMPADPRYLSCFASLVPADAVWGVLQHGMRDQTLLMQAAALGAAWLRVGFEDSPYYGGDRQARSNRELVLELRELLERCGYETVSPEEARRMLGMNGNDSRGEGSSG